MPLPDWLISTLIPLPAFLWVILGVGLPWALVALPRRDWAGRVTVMLLAFAFGPLLLTAWMGLLGILGAVIETPLLRLDLILAGTVGLALIGAALAWRKRRPAAAEPPPALPLQFDEKLLIGLIAAALLLRFVSIAFWPFTAYDALWVFGYEGRLYTLLGMIPHRIDYYPQFMPLLYTFGQLVAGGINDHAARAAIFFTHTGSILAVHVLGARLFNRRVGIFAAALWALYPHVGEWARFGDLEIPLTFLFTGAAAFFLLAWTHSDHRRRYALIAGLLLGGAMWTKPTAGAFIWGVLLLLAVELVRLRFDWRAWRPRFEVAFFTGLASIPLGAVWYARNALLGHNVIDFPTGFWLTQAARSGREFGWPLLALIVLLALAYFGPLSIRSGRRRALIGLLLVLAAVLPSILAPSLDSALRSSPLLLALLPSLNPPHRMGALEWALLAVGLFILCRVLGPLLSARLSAHPAGRSQAAKVGWALLLALPYVVTWFYSYSYHYRLSFAIVPLLLLPTAALLAYGLPPVRLRAWAQFRRWGYAAALILLALPGVVSTLYDGAAGWDWLWNGQLVDDTAKYTSGNAALMWVVDGLQKYIDEHPDQPLVVAAPGVVRLPFFFPLADIRVDEAPTRWSQLEDVVYFIDSAPEGRGAYADIPLADNQVLSGLALAGSSVENILRKAWWKDDGFFNYTVYELHLDRRFENPATIHDPAEPVIFGDFVRFRGHGIGGDTFWPGRPILLQLYWETLAPAQADYTIYVHLRDANDQVQATWDGPVSHSQDGRYYTTLVWEPGEFIRDERRLRFTAETLPPVGEGYRIVIGFYNLQTQERLPVTIGGQPAGDGFTLNERLKVIAQEP
jgi:4-amino-4-deoxy-L-arabinose transferase-like glycosyltransferase